MAKSTSSMKKSTSVGRAPVAPMKPTPPATGAGTVREVKPTVDQIRQRAYQIYTQRIAGGAGNGDQQSDWLRAERELNDGRR